MRKLKRLSSILALMLTLSMVLSACQVPEGVEVPPGVSIPSDLSDLTSEDAQTQVVVKGTVDLPSGRDWVHKILNVEEYVNPDPWIQADTAPFLSTGNDMMEMAWFLTKMTGDPKYAVWGDRMLEKYMGVAHPETLLVGEQYGNPIDMNYGGDRLLYSVLGADFVTNSGFDFKTATMDDYKVAGANCLINRTGTKCNTAYGPQVYAQAYRDLGNERLYEFCVRNLVGLAKEDADVDTALYIDNIKIYQ